MATSGISLITVGSLRGCLNNSDPSIAIPEDQATVANNVEFVTSMCGERRLGTSAITLPASISGKDRVTFLFRHLPSADETAATLWALGVTGTASYQLSYKDTTWHDITISDTVSLAGFNQYRWQATSYSGKAFFAFKSNVDRLHVYDTLGAFRRVGMAAPAAAPTGADEGVGTFSGTRYYRVRYIEKSGSTILRRSEPSAVLTFSPDGDGAGVTVTKPATVSEGETDWELEASTDNAFFYVLSTIAVATTTYNDETDIVTGYSSGDLSETISAYTLIGSARYLTIDGDRLIYGGSYEDATLDSRVGWTPVSNAFGVGNAEREDDTVASTLNLDTYAGGAITGLSSSSAGAFFAFKYSRLYKLVRTGARTSGQAYDVVPLSTTRGALHGSVVSGVDQLGNPSVYFLDPSVGPCRYGSGGLEWCGWDIRNTWNTFNRDATQVTCSGVYDPIKRQVQWCIATGNSNIPSLGITLQTDRVVSDQTGTKRGWVTWDGTRASALAMCMYATNIEAGTARSLTLRPFIALQGSGLVHQVDTGNDDNGTAYVATVTTKPYTPTSILNKAGIMVGAILGKAVTGAAVVVSIIRGFGLETFTAPTVSFTPVGSETQIIKLIDNLKMSEANAIQFSWTDDPSNSASWQVNQLVLKSRPEQTA